MPREANYEQGKYHDNDEREKVGNLVEGGRPDGAASDSTALLTGGESELSGGEQLVAPQQQQEEGEDGEDDEGGREI